MELTRVPVLGAFVRRLHATIDHRVEQSRTARHLEWIEAERLRHLDMRMDSLDQAIQRLAPQVAALEVRFEDRRLDELANRMASPTAAEVATIMELIGEEQRRVTVRLAALSHFEERLRRLEIAN
ncbi:hypothetical protein [Schumannella soli]|uniref:Uncharacterized protein n=1 Tax=Schumannella soli TaxID=2590779 RepID=A0A506Y6W0_9MICO|nr:hypothetical protein [Schumannella soli]TPW77250.1 hypothetical protein FJ657_00645 [Schumannella soli]